MKRRIGNFNCADVDGWLDRQGKFYPCKFEHHNDAEQKLIKQFQLKHCLEYLGWIKVHSAGCYFFKARSWHGRMHVRMTESQEKWLIDNRYQIEE